MSRSRKLGRGVAVVGAGMTRFGSFPGYSSRDLFVEAFQEMLSSVDQGINPRDVEALFIGNFSSDQFEKQGHIAPIMAEWIGLAPRPAARIEDACASGGVALRQGIQAIASGLYDIVLVGGVEKMTGLPTEQVTDSLATAADMAYEVPGGFTFPGFYAAMATAYMHRYDATPETLMRVAIKNHDNGALNAKAQFGKRISDTMKAKKASALKKGLPEPTWQNEMEFLHDEQANPIIAWPLRLFDCSPISDGAAALLLVSEDLARSFTDKPLHVLGTGQASDGALHDRIDLTGIPAARYAAQEAYAMAGIGPEAVKVAEVHDCFTIAEIMATEDLGFFQPGEGGVAAEEGLTTRQGPRPVNTSGGLKSKGHPVGASGVGQVVEVWKQMRREAGERQVAGEPDIGLVHNVGGSGQTCAVTIFERR
jgi:acetyl-CoA C-acetyltransferase